MYDVLDPVRLRHVHKICRSWGERVQLSIFRVRGTARELAHLEFELARVMEATDRLLLVRLCPGCASVVKVKGPQLEPFELEVPPCKLFLERRSENRPWLPLGVVLRPVLSWFCWVLLLPLDGDPLAQLARAGTGTKPRASAQAVPVSPTSKGGPSSPLRTRGRQG
jgi:CRISPR-associated protein Cas2